MWSMYAHGKLSVVIGFGLTLSYSHEDLEDEFGNMKLIGLHSPSFSLTENLWT